MANIANPIAFHRVNQGYLSWGNDTLDLQDMKHFQFNVSGERRTAIVTTFGTMGYFGQKVYFHLNFPTRDEFVRAYKAFIEKTDAKFTLYRVNRTKTEAEHDPSGEYVSTIQWKFLNRENCEIFREAILPAFLPDANADVDDKTLTLAIKGSTIEKTDQAVQDLFNRLDRRTSDEAMICNPLFNDLTPTYYLSSEPITVDRGEGPQPLCVPTPENVRELDSKCTDALKKLDRRIEREGMLKEYWKSVYGSLNGFITGLVFPGCLSFERINNRLNSVPKNDQLTPGESEYLSRLDPRERIRYILQNGEKLEELESSKKKGDGCCV